MSKYLIDVIYKIIYLYIMKNKIKKILISAIIIILLLYIIVTLLLYLFQNKIIYHPNKTITQTPASIGLGYKRVNFKSIDGIKLSGWFIPAQKERGIVLFCHGNAWNISSFMDTIKLYNKLDLSFFIFDYRGFGESDGFPSEYGTYLDADGAWHYLTESLEIPADKIIYIGRSLGGSIVANLATIHKPKLLILESTFTSLKNIGSDLFPIFPVRYLLSYEYPTVEYLKKINIPILIVHSKQDELISINHGRILFKNASQPKEFLQINGNHDNGYITSGNLYKNGIDNFISKYLKRIVQN